MPVKVEAPSFCYNCRFLIKKTWSHEGKVHVVECFNFSEERPSVETRHYGPHDGCWCPRWKPWESN